MSAGLTPARLDRLFDLVKQHDMRVLTILDDWPPCGTAVHLGRTVLMAAVDDENLPVAQKILDSNPAQAYLEYEHAGTTVLDVAIERGYHEIVRKIAPLVSQKTRTRSLGIAIAVQDCEAVNILRNAGVDMDI